LELDPMFAYRFHGLAIDHTWLESLGGFDRWPLKYGALASTTLTFLVVPVRPPHAGLQLCDIA